MNEDVVNPFVIYNHFDKKKTKKARASFEGIYINPTFDVDSWPGTKPGDVVYQTVDNKLKIWIVIKEDMTVKDAYQFGDKIIELMFKHEGDLWLETEFLNPSLIIILAHQIVLAAKQKYKNDYVQHINKRISVIKQINQAPNIIKLIKQSVACAIGIAEARSLGDMPSNVLTPSYYQEFIADPTWPSVKTADTVTKTVVTESDMKKLGMNSFLSVGSGCGINTSTQPRLICLEYNGTDTPNSSSPVVLVGKGITFDSGGISLKPGSNMDEMKFDMCGSAAVLGAFKTLVLIQAKVHVVALLAIAENMPGAEATRPGDVVTSLSGKTIEIQNTDAEGRLVLCDTLSYAQKFYNPYSIIDVATLTGSCAATFSDVVAGIMSNCDQFSENMFKIGEDLGERVWRLPLHKEYDKLIESKNADLSNLGSGAGCITAGLFLSKFVDQDIPWIHLDIAGTAWKNKKATGYGVKLLVGMVLSEYEYGNVMQNAHNAFIKE